VREAVFSSLGDTVVDAVVADLYAGSGSYGLEALSRGASSAVFVEKGRKALIALKANIGVVGLGGVIVARAVEDYLASSPSEFDLVFIDPPWEMSTTVLDTRLSELDHSLRAGSSVVVSRRSKDVMPEAPETWRVAADKRYGDTRILRYEKLKANP
jgi:16S rRNA (guanine966-N2)-methyltransferase